MGNQAGLSVTHQDMLDAATYLQGDQGKGAVETVLNSMKSYIDGLINNGFMTQYSSDAYGAKYDEFTGGMRQVLDGIDGLADFLRTASQTFQDADLNLRNAVNGS